MNNNLIIYDGSNAILELIVNNQAATSGANTVDLDDNSYRDWLIMGDNVLNLAFSSSEFIEIPAGAYCTYKGIKYTLERPENFKKNGSRKFKYSLTMDAPQARLHSFIFRNTVPGDRRLKFSLTARPHEHLKMLVDNLNERDSGWSMGEYIDSVEKTISYNHTSCSEALSLMANEFGTEWEINDKVISLRKVEYFKENPLPLSYGKGNGFTPELGRTNFDNSKPIQRLFIQGGTRNIDRSKYGSNELLLPKNAVIAYDGVHFDDESGFDLSKARYYATDAEGFSIIRTDKAMDIAEASLDLSDIYPSRVGEVTGVEVIDEEGHVYDFFDETIPEELDFSKYRIDGEVITIVFQSGMLAGRELEISQNENGVSGYVHSERRFKLVPQEIDGITMPDEIYKPRVGDKYAIFGIMLPDEYISNNSDKSGASWDMLREGVKHKYENEDSRFTFTGELDGIWAKKDWENIVGRLIPGGYVLFSDTQFQQEGVPIRIMGIKDYINKPHSPKIDLSNVTAGGGFRSTVERLAQNEVIIEDRHKDSISFTKRRFRDAQETMSMLSKALLNFDAGINPVFVHTMMMLVGDESLQFRFVDNKTNPTAIAHDITYDPITKALKADAGILQHMTLGIKDISSSHKIGDYSFWDIPEYVSDSLTDPKAYYFYAKVSRTDGTGEFRLEADAVGMYDDPEYYYLLIGMLNSEYDGDRSWAPMYGFSEVLPGRITTERVVSSDGLNYMDFLRNAFKIGNNNTFLSFNEHGDKTLRIKGTIVQSPSGVEAPIEVNRGAWSSGALYFKGDKVTHNGSTYLCILDAPTIGVLPTNTTYWQVDAAKGENGSPGQNAVLYILQPSVSVIHRDDSGNYDTSTISCRIIKTDGNSQAATSLPSGYTMDYLLNGNTAKSYSPGTEIQASTITTDIVFRLYREVESIVMVDSIKVAVVADGKNGKDGKDGKDGNGVEYVFKRSRSLGSDDPVRPTDVVQQDEYVPAGWTDDPTGVTEAWPLEWVCQRKKTGGTWGAFSDPAMWAKFSKDGESNFVSFVFKASDEQPATPTGTNLIPDGWSDAPPVDPTGIEKTFVFSRDAWGSGGAYPGFYQSLPFTGSNTTTIRRITFTTPQDDVVMRLEIYAPLGAYGDASVRVGKANIAITVAQPSDTDIAGSVTSGIEGKDRKIVDVLVPKKGSNFIDIQFSRWNTYVNPSFYGLYRFVGASIPKFTWMSKSVINGHTGLSDGKWSVPARINGEDGEGGGFVDFKFRKNNSPTVSPDILNTSRNPVDWLDNPPILNTGEYLWMTSADIDADNNLVGTWTSPVRISGESGKDGKDGKDGNGVEYVFKRSRSLGSDDPVRPTDVVQQDEYVPAGWTDDPTGVTEAWPLEWVCQRKKTGGTWGAFSDPAMWAKFSKDGKDGEDGENGRQGPSIIFRGEYNALSTYYGNDMRIDVVKYGGMYYKTKNTSGEFYGKVPTDQNYWENFGAQFESIATGTLLAEYANVGELIFKDGQLISQAGTINGIDSTDYSNPNFMPNIIINGKTGFVQLKGQSLLRVPFKDLDEILNNTTLKLDTYFNYKGAVSAAETRSLLLPVGDQYNGVQSIIYNNGLTRSNGAIAVKTQSGASIIIGGEDLVNNTVPSVVLNFRQFAIFVCLGDRWVCTNYRDING